MRFWGRATAGVALATVFVLLLCATAATADDTPPPTPPPPTAAQEAFRADFEAFLAGLQDVVTQTRANPRTAKSLDSTGTNPVPMIAVARERVAELDSTALDQLQATLEPYPGWQDMPNTLSGAVAAFGGSPFGIAIVTSGSGTFTDNCTSAGDPVGEFVGVSVANQVQSALQAAMMSAPGVAAVFFVDVPTGVKIALAVAWGISNGVYLALAQTLAVSTDCADTAFGNTQAANLPVDPTGSDTVVPASSQISIDRLIAKAGDTQTKLTTVQGTVHTVEGQADTLTAAAAALNTTLNDTADRVTEAQTDLQTLQANVDILKNTEVTILKKSDTEIANLTTFQTLQLRMKIEENLARIGDGTGAVGLFELPAAYGGYLEVVRSIVTETIAKEIAIGSTIPQAAKNLALANAAFTAGQYKTAYGYYVKAYHYAQ